MGRERVSEEKVGAGMGAGARDGDDDDGTLYKANLSSVGLGVISWCTSVTSVAGVGALGCWMSVDRKGGLLSELMNRLA